MISEPNKKLVLEDGSEYVGYGFGADSEVIAEIVFNTSVVGYQEIISDPSYTNQMVVMTRCFIPVNTVTRIVVAVPPMAQFETGFSRWVRAIGNLTREIGCKVIFCCHPDTQPLIKGVYHRERYDIRHEYRDVEQWEDFVLLSNRILDDDLFILVSARESSVSHNNDMADIPGFLQKYFSRNNLIVLYPEQFGQAEPINTFVDPMSSDIHSVPSPLWFKLHGAYRKLVQLKKNLSKRSDRKKIDL